MRLPLDKPVYLVCGEDEFRVGAAVRDVLDALIPETERAFGLERVDGRVETVDETLRLLRAVRDALLADGLFGGARTVWLRDPSFLCVERVARSAAVKEGVAALSKRIREGLPEGSRLVVSTVKVNRAHGFFKACAAAGHVVDLGSGLKGRALAEAAQALLAEYLPKAGLTMDASARAAFLARVGTDSRRIVSELEKLACYCGSAPGAPPPAATAADVAAVVSRGAVSEIWDFTDALAWRDAKALAQQIRRQLDQGENAIRLAGSAYNAVSDLLFVRDALDRGWAASAAGRGGIDWGCVPEGVAEGLAASGRDLRASLSGWRGDRALQQASRWKAAELRAARRCVLALREELVSRQVPQDTLLELRLFQALGAGGP